MAKNLITKIQVNFVLIYSFLAVPFDFTTFFHTGNFKWASEFREME